MITHIIIISAKNIDSINRLASPFVEQQGYTVVDWKPYQSSIDDLAALASYFIVVRCIGDAFPTLIQLQTAKIKASVHYITIEAYGTYGAEPQSL